MAAPLIPYIRQSRKKEQTISIESQRDEIERWAKAHDVKLAPEVVEQGVSGSKPWRERELGAVITACQTGEADGVIVAFQDRLSRENGLGTAEVYEALEAAGARLVCAAEGLDTATGGSDTEMLFTIKAAVARHQWKRYQANWAKATEKAVANGKYQGLTPVGFERNADGTLRQNADARNVRDAFLKRTQGRSLSALCSDMEAASVKTATGSAQWHINSMRSLISNPIYKGTLKNGIEHHFATYAVVTPSEWAEAQPAKDDGRRGRGNWALLGGMLTCACCHGAMSPSREFRGGKTYASYRCQNRACSAQARIRAEAIEGYIVPRALDAFAAGVADRGIGTEGDVEKIAALEIALREAKARERAALLRMDPDDAEDAELLEALATDVESCKAALTDESGKHRSTITVEEARKILDGGTLDERREAIRRVVDGIIVSRKGTSVWEASPEGDALAWGFEAPATDTDPLNDRVRIEWRWTK